VDKKKADLKSEFELTAQKFEKVAQDASSKMLLEASALLDAEKQGLLPGLKLDLFIDTEGWDVKALKESLKKGEVLDPSEMEKLFKGEVVADLLVLFSDIVPAEGSNLLNGNFKGAIDRTKYFQTMGERFLINSKRDKVPLDFATASRQCFEAVLGLTSDTPYLKERQVAMKRLGELKSIQKPEAITCPKCKRAMDASWKYCPFDGTAISNAKK
jgi:hypothetical protein